MNWTKNPSARRSIRSLLWAPHWRELYAWLLAGLLLDTLVRCGGPGFDPRSAWDLGVGVLTLAAVRTGLVGWADLLTGRDR
ncbi:hypothetical protein ACFXOL_10890 [Streptomyces californicus]|uniref:hypothetical protein n=1 Tax=Streptomyces californicus TaxID=67351 RepID=UPI0036566B3A